MGASHDQSFLVAKTFSMEKFRYICKDDGAHNSEESIKYKLIQIPKWQIKDSLVESFYNVSFLAKISLRNRIQMTLGETFVIIHKWTRVSAQIDMPVVCPVGLLIIDSLSQVKSEGVLVQNLYKMCLPESWML
jgi:hypothetical protein